MVTGEKIQSYLERHREDAAKHVIKKLGLDPVSDDVFALICDIVGDGGVTLASIREHAREWAAGRVEP